MTQKQHFVYHHQTAKQMQKHPLLSLGKYAMQRSPPKLSATCGNTLSPLHPIK